MSDFRPASIFADDIETLESAGEALFRHHENADAIRLLAIALRLRGQTGFYRSQVSGAVGDLAVTGSASLTAGHVVPGEPVRLPSYFACDDVDESAGLADVVELNGYSRKTPPMGCGA